MIYQYIQLISINYITVTYMKFCHHSLEFIKVQFKLSLPLVQEVIWFLLHVGHNDIESCC